MPIPKPKKDETQSEFISRCTSNKTMKKEFPKQQQRVAVCVNQWKKKGESNMDNKKRDENGRIIVAENVSLIITASINPDMEEKDND